MLHWDWGFDIPDWDWPQDSTLACYAIVPDADYIARAEEAHHHGLFARAATLRRKAGYA